MACATTVQSALKDIDGVASAVVDLRKREVAVRYDAKRAQVSDLVDAVSRSGFEASPNSDN